jgi:hypothetical protein
LRESAAPLTYASKGVTQIVGYYIIGDLFLVRVVTEPILDQPMGVDLGALLKFCPRNGSGHGLDAHLVCVPSEVKEVGTLPRVMSLRGSGSKSCGSCRALTTLPPTG